MASLGAIKRIDLIVKLRKLGFEGPLPGGKHAFMLRAKRRLVLLNPHKGDISAGLLARLLRQAEITREQWEAL